MNMQDTLKENKMKVRSRLEEQRKQLKKEQRKETILTFIIGSFIFVATTMLLSNMNNNFVSDCKAAGHTQSYCERGL